MMMEEHLDLTLVEASACLNGDWDADIAAYDEIHVQILDMADMFRKPEITSGLGGEQYAALPHTAPFYIRIALQGANEDRHTLRRKIFYRL